MKNLIDILDFTTEELDELIDTALDIIDNPGRYSEACRGKKLATLFFEPSTRTRLSFEAAMYELGGNVLSVAGAASSSAAKGESISDTARVISCYADIIAMRHPLEGSALVASEAATVPLVNAGDGGHCHPTQTLADILTIKREKGRLDNLTIGLCGDLLYGRTVHSLVKALKRYENVKWVFISPDELKMPSSIKSTLSSDEYIETADLADALPKLDVLYMTRIQRERFASEESYNRLKDSYVLTAEMLKLASEDCIVMHPLPRVNEISVDVDSDPRACYFKQVENGKYMRMALILKLLYASDASDVSDASDDVDKSYEADVVGKINEVVEAGEVIRDIAANEKQPALGQLPDYYAIAPDAPHCSNPRCVLTAEQELKPRYFFDEAHIPRCLYCESELVEHV